MRKSNWIILAVLVIASIFFLWLWYYLKFDLVDHPRDLILTILWWVVVLAACVGIHYVEKMRQRNIRTAFLAPVGSTSWTSLNGLSHKLLFGSWYGADMICSLPSFSVVRTTPAATGMHAW